MDTQHLSAPARRGGVIQVKVKHTKCFTVIGNHLAQHEELSLLAIGLATHIQSLPDGTDISIRSLAERFPEGEIRIAAGLRELEKYGYLSRTLERLAGGRMATRTVSYNRPGATMPDEDPDDDPEPPAPEPDPEPPPKRAPTPPILPEGPSTDLLLGLRAHEPRLLLSVRDVQRLAPGVDAWFARGAHPDAIRRTLTACLPDHLKYPAGLLAHRLTTMLPPPLPPTPPRADPMQTCEDCDRAFRAPEPGRCRDCRPSAKRLAA